MMSDFIKLNPMQKKAVDQTLGPVLILAGAGSGKTGALTARTAALVKDGVAPWNILSITFTNKAAKEMKERVRGVIGEAADKIWISTFHSACVKILRRDIEKIGYESSFSIYDADDSEKLLRECFKELNFDIYDKTFTVKSTANAISGYKDELISWEDCIKNAEGDKRKIKLAEAYRAYQNRLKRNNALDFDDIIYKTVELFKANPDVLDYYQEKFKYIMVDEYQDTNTAQYSFIKLLAGKYGNLCVVGDDDQSIYGWRGANIRNILDFEKDFPGAVIIRLEQNYRSTKTILDAANNVIKHNLSRKGKTLWTENEEGGIIHRYHADNEYDEARFIAEKISKIYLNGHKYSEIAILYRLNSQSRVLEECLAGRLIPAKIYGGTRFYERREIKDIISYLKVLVNPSDDVALKRIINIPKRGIGDTTVSRISEFAAKEEISFFEAMNRIAEVQGLSGKSNKIKEFKELIYSLKSESKKLLPTEVIDKVLTQTGYMSMLKEENSDEAMMRMENLDEFISKATEFEETAEPDSEDTLAGFLEEVSLVSDIDSLTNSDDTVSLMTLHSAKGLEFPYIFIAGMEEGLFPGSRSIADVTGKGIEEERRLCYVGMTRAKTELYLTSAAMRLWRGERKYSLPSRFFDEIPKELLDEIKPVGVSKKSHINTSGRDKSFGGFKPYSVNYKKNATLNDLLTPKEFSIDFSEGDKVRAPKYGIGTVKKVTPAGADFEVEISFPEKGIKKFMARLSKIIKV